MNTNQEQELTQNPVSQSGENNQPIEGVQKGEFYQKIISLNKFHDGIMDTLNRKPILAK